ncbi:hypothetical protein C8Q79DRAFT_297386 [Trametes meyenii]|nr:hypothetical protein C8Q79DRAFT_297386 [Trametes meyenii]
MHALFFLSLAAMVMGKPAPTPKPVITPAPVVDGLRLVRRDDVPGTIPLAQCSASVECCKDVFTLPTVPSDIPSLISGVLGSLSISGPIPVPTLGPRFGVQCNGIKDSDITDDQWCASYPLFVWYG